MASSASLFGRAVLMPTRVGFLPEGTSSNSQEYCNFLFGLLAGDSQTFEPGSFRPSMAPGFAQWAVISSPVSNFTSARKRL